jgi:hypothetical protein
MSAPRLPYAVTLATRVRGGTDLDIATFEYANLELARSFFHDCCTDPATLSVTLDGPDEEPLAEYEESITTAHIPPATAWALTIEHKGGHGLSLHTTQAGAEARLLEYVHRRWTQQVLDDDDNPVLIPADPDEAIERYFDSDRTEHESWYIDQYRINDTHPNPEN